MTTPYITEKIKKESKDIFDKYNITDSQITTIVADDIAHLLRVHYYNTRLIKNFKVTSRYDKKNLEPTIIIWCKTNDDLSFSFTLTTSPPDNNVKAYHHAMGGI